MVVYFGVIMIPRVTCNMTSYRAMPKKSEVEPDDILKEDDEPKVLKSTIGNRMLAGFHRTSNAFLEYTAKGFNGDVNSNFYEFLALGRVPYLIGSGTFIALFNAMNKHFSSSEAQAARKTGLKFATGVVLYGLIKTLSKDLVSRPVAWATGVDIEQPYINNITPFPKIIKGKPEKKGDPRPFIVKENPDTQIQYQKLYESREFPRIDLLKEEDFERIARKNGLGTDLNCAETEVKPLIKNVISTATTAQRVSSFLWAACGVALAACGNWDEFYDTYLRSSGVGGFVPDKEKSFIENAKARVSHYLNHSKQTMVGLKDTIVTSSKEFYNGPAGSTGFKKHAGKALLWTAAASSVLGVANTIIRARAMGSKLCNDNVIDKSKDSMVV